MPKGWFSNPLFENAEYALTISSRYTSDVPRAIASTALISVVIPILLAVEVTSEAGTSSLTIRTATKFTDFLIPSRKEVSPLVEPS